MFNNSVATAAWVVARQCADSADVIANSVASSLLYKRLKTITFTLPGWTFFVG